MLSDIVCMYRLSPVTIAIEGGTCRFIITNDTGQGTLFVTTPRGSLMPYRRDVLIGATALATTTLAGCLGDDGTEFSIQPGADSSIAEAEVSLEAGTYELFVSFDSYDPEGDGIDEEFVSCALTTDDYEETIAEVEVTEEHATETETVDIEQAGDYIATLYAPTTKSEATATLERL